MNPDSLLTQLIDGIPWQGQMLPDIQAFLTYHQCPNTLTHSLRVAQQAHKLAVSWGADPNAAEIAGLLHDISAVIPISQRVQAARQFQIDILPEEEQVPLLLHQKLSVVISQKIFGVTDPAVLSAIGCHTTLKAKASVLDKVLFIADKIEWDQPDQSPYGEDMQRALEQSLDQAVWIYLDYVWQQRQTLLVIHPWLSEAYQQLACKMPGQARFNSGSFQDPNL